MNNHSDEGYKNQLIRSGLANYENHQFVGYHLYRRAAHLLFLSLIMLGAFSSIGLLYKSVFFDNVQRPTIRKTDEHPRNQPNKATEDGSGSTDTIQSHKVKSIRIPLP